ncbi:MAG: dihydrolipoyllysine-residue acetyltransferase [Actinomycetota bacterium]|nr:dihydrolipoyllysine-residue acetyltransferase [Actinomycetota bacterium]
MSSSVETVLVPDIGDFGEVPIIEILVSPGDTVAVEDPLVTLESDKATMDVPAPVAGVVRALKVKIGDRVAQGVELLTIEATNGSDPTAVANQDPAPAPAEAAKSTPPVESSPPESAPPQPSAPPNDDRPIYASPSARRLARELAVPLAGMTGSGRGGRITRDDVQQASERPASGAASASGAGVGGLDLPPWPTVDFAKFGPVERVPRSRIQRISAPNLARNWVMIPHVTHHDDADITDLEAWRKRLNSEQDVKVTMVAFLVKACVAALKAFPDFNASLDGDELVVKGYYNVGFAADTPGGLVVPVIKGADGKGLLEIAAELGELSGRARAGKLGPADMSGSTFTISSLGGIGGTGFTPIVNAPEVAILGVTRSAIKPVWDGSEFRPRLMVPLSLSYDHRVIDGAAAARFVVYLCAVLSDLRRALL